MAGDSRLADGEGFDEFAGAALSLAQHLHDSASRWVCERFKRIHGGTIALRLYNCQVIVKTTENAKQTLRTAAALLSAWTLGRVRWERLVEAGSEAPVADRTAEGAGGGLEAGEDADTAFEEFVSYLS